MDTPTVCRDDWGVQTVIRHNGAVVAPPPSPDLVEPKGPLSPVRILFRVVVGIVIAASFGVWLYAYSGAADKPPPDELDSTRALLDARDAGTEFEEFDGVAPYGQRATSICENAIGSLPDARLADSGETRAMQLREANRILTDMIGDLRELRVATLRDDELRNLWLDDWEVLVGDRARYADAVQDDPAAVFSVSAVADGERLERRLTRFARTNLMLACGAPSDLG